MKTMTKSILAALLFAVAAFSQASIGENSSRVGGIFVASNYGLWSAKIYTGFTGTGAQSFTVYTPIVALPDGRIIVPFATNEAILVGAGSTAETVTPSAVTNCTRNLPGLGVCTITATFTNAHGSGELVQSGTFGLSEAINDANLSGGGVVMVDSQWKAMGGVNSTITGATGFTNVSIIDGRGTASGAAFSYKAASNGANYAITTVSWY